MSKLAATITYYGDNHPVYAGNVVKAMASAKIGYQEIVRLFAAEVADLDPARQAEREAQFSQLLATLDDNLIARVVRVDRLTPTIVEIFVRAPYAARKFHPGQFYRLQNYETNAVEVDGTLMMMEGLALTGAWTDPEQGLAFADRAGNGRQFASVRGAQAGRASGGDGADRRAD